MSGINDPKNYYDKYPLPPFITSRGGVRLHVTPNIGERAIDAEARTWEEYYSNNPDEKPKQVATAIKHDQEKLPVELLDPLALEGLTAVLAFGAKKYAAHNWRGGFKYTRLIGALLRHTFAILRGEDNDPESGLPHIDHVGCCWMFLSNMMKTRKDLDDRWQSQETRGVSGAGFSNPTVPSATPIQPTNPKD